MAKKKQKPVEYSASINLMGKTYLAQGASVSEAVGNLKPSITKGRAILTVTRDGVTKEKILNAPTVFRLFTASRLMREVALKQISQLFDNV